MIDETTSSCALLPREKNNCFVYDYRYLALALSLWNDECHDDIVVHSHCDPTLINRGMDLDAKPTGRGAHDNMLQWLCSSRSGLENVANIVDKVLYSSIVRSILDFFISDSPDAANTGGHGWQARYRRTLL